jgi:hypothetical protein
MEGLVDVKQREAAQCSRTLTASAYVSESGQVTYRT